jgi:excisionase family DNA binding protein
MTEDRVPLFVRLPSEQAAALDQLVQTTGRRKQELVSELLAERIIVGRAEGLGGAALDDVLTLEETAALLRLEPDAVRASALAGELPGRRFGEQWRFAREALIAWLAHGESAGGREPVRPGAQG